MGLGDRHGENMLFDASSGDVVHVDFSCLFDKVWTPPQGLPHTCAWESCAVFTHGLASAVIYVISALYEHYLRSNI